MEELLQKRCQDTVATPYDDVFRTLINDCPRFSVSYEVPAIKIRSFALDEIFEKRLYMLIPFYIFVYSRKLYKYENDEAQLGELKGTFQRIRSHLEESQDSGILTEYEKQVFLSMSKKVIDNLTAKYANLDD